LCPISYPPERLPKFLFSRLSSQGIYVIEDTQTSYWEGYGGNNEDFNSLQTSMGFFKSLIDGLNYEEFKLPNYQPNQYDKTIISISFYHNLIFIQKGDSQ
jgi:demethylmacrocin O-methyltransferase